MNATLNAELNSTLRLGLLRGHVTLSPRLLRAWLGGQATPDPQVAALLGNDAGSVMTLNHLHRNIKARPERLLSETNWYHTAQSVQTLSSSLPITPGPLTPRQWAAFGVSWLGVQACLMMLKLLADQQRGGQSPSHTHLHHLNLGARLIGSGEQLADWLGPLGAQVGTHALLRALSDPLTEAALLTSLPALPGEGEIGLHAAKYALSRLPASRNTPGLMLALIGHQPRCEPGGPALLDWRGLPIQAVMDAQAPASDVQAVREVVARTPRRATISPERDWALLNLRCVPAPDEPGHPARALLLLSALRLMHPNEASVLRQWFSPGLSQADQADAQATRTLARTLHDSLFPTVHAALTGAS